MAFRFLAMVFLSAAQRRLFATGVPILTYHSVGPRAAGARDPFLYVPTAQFDAQLARLRSESFQTVSLSEAVAGPEDSARKVVITFDDGCANVFQNALPALAKHQAKAIQFLIAKLIGGKNDWMIKHGDAPETLMDVTQIKEWLAAGHEIGSHTSTHPNLPKLSLAAAREEIAGSKKILEDFFGQPVRHFAYPGGKWNEALRDIVAEAGYETACTTNFGVNPPGAPRHELRRIVPLTRSELIGKSFHRLRRKFRP
ncbi:MAG: polysaccharide deacetylase family protein [Pedosphaera sp.]|nr:polysaccharide deacetylase family protein [Pedosphaera sp.]